MAKYERGTARSTASINDELEKIQNSLADKFDRKPSSGEPNQLETNLDMNGNRIYNLPDPQSSRDAVPKDYLDSALVDVNAQAVTPIEVARETGDGATVAYTVPNSLSSPARSYLVHLDGVRQKPITDYNVVGTTLTFTTAPANGVAIDITYYEPQVANNLDSINVYDTVDDAKADVTLVVGDSVKTLGYYSINDGGGVEYVVVAGGTGTDDGGSYHDCTNGLQLKLLAKRPTTRHFGFNGDLSSNDVTAIDNLLSAYDDVVLAEGEYPPYVFSQTGKSIHLSQGTVFKLPDGTTNASTTEPVRVFEVTGSNLVFYGKLVVEGNFTNNPSDSMNTSDRRGAVHIAGTSINFTDEIYVENSNWVAFSTGSEVDKATDLFVDLVRVVNPRSYATSLWSVDGGMLNRIEIKSGADSLDARFRSGSQTSSTFNCENVTIGQILSNDSVVFEARTNDTTVGLIIADACKVEDCGRVSISTVLIKDTTGASFAFAIISANAVTVESVLVDGYAGTAGKVISLTEVVDCTMGSVMVSNTQSDNCNDFEIRSANGLTVDKIFCRSPNGVNTRGFFFDYDVGYAPQKDIRIGSIVSTGHDIFDAEIQSPELVDIVIRDLNEDATTNRESYKNSSKYNEGVFPANLVPDGGSVSLSGSQTDLAYTKTGRVVTVTGRLQVSAVSSPTGGITLGTLPYSAVNAPDLGGYTQFMVVVTNTTGTFSGVFYGTLTEGGNTVYIYGLDGNTTFSSADKLQIGTTLSFNFSYLTVVVN